VKWRSSFIGLGFVDGFLLGWLIMVSASFTLDILSSELAERSALACDRAFCADFGTGEPREISETFLNLEEGGTLSGVS
jgi:hypothetical protein